MSSENKPKTPGRPPTGETPKRNVRIGEVWDHAERAALELARVQGKVRQVRNRATGEIEERGDMTAFVEEALRREIRRVERLVDYAIGEAAAQNQA